MDHVCTIGFNDGSRLVIDGYDEIFFIKEVPYVDISFTGYDLQNDEYKYYLALNNLANHPYIGIKRHDNKHELEFAGKKYVYSNFAHSLNKSIENNEILYVQTSSVSTIVVYEQWSK